MSHSNSGRWPIGECWVYDRHLNYLATITYFDQAEMDRSVQFLAAEGHVPCPRHFYQAKEA
jgi:hypothetical protein